MSSHQSQHCSSGPSALDEALSALPTPLPDTVRAGGVSGGREIVVVLGMHRSGTSLLSNILHLLGVDMADESDHASASNPGGFWERPPIVALQDEVLAKIGRPIDSPLHSLPLPAGWWRTKPVQSVKKRLRIFVAEQLSQCPGRWGFKDPRTCRLLPLWWEIFEELGLKARYVWAVRAPGEVSASMAAKNPVKRPMSPAQAEVTWLAYNYDTLRYSAETDRIIVDYREWFRDPLIATNRIRSRLHLPGLTSEQELSESLRLIVKEEYRHEIDGTGRAVPNIPLAQNFFEEMLASAYGGDETDHRLLGYLAVLDVVFRALEPFVDLLASVPRLRRELREARELIKSLGGPEDRSV